MKFGGGWDKEMIGCYHDEFFVLVRIHYGGLNLKIYE